MQTFLPYRSFMKSALTLDYRRLGKQRVEAMQILRAIREGGAWAHHPIVRLWSDYTDALCEYYNCMVIEWRRRGYVNTMPLLELPGRLIDRPRWLNDDFIRDHRSNLLRKDPVYYGQFDWDVPSDLPYIWS